MLPCDYSQTPPADHVHPHPKRVWPSVVQPGIPVSPPAPSCTEWKHIIGLQCQTEGQVGTQSPFILCAPACNLHIILQNCHKFFALLFPLPFFLLSEIWSSHSPGCFYISFIEGHIACCLFSFLTLLSMLPFFLFHPPFCPLLFLSSRFSPDRYMHLYGFMRMV